PAPASMAVTIFCVIASCTSSLGFNSSYVRGFAALDRAVFFLMFLGFVMGALLFLRGFAPRAPAKKGDARSLLNRRFGCPLASAPVTGRPASKSNRSCASSVGGRCFVSALLRPRGGAAAGGTGIGFSVARCLGAAF